MVTKGSAFDVHFYVYLNGLYLNAYFSDTTLND